MLGSLKFKLSLPAGKTFFLPVAHRSSINPRILCTVTGTGAPADT